MCIKIEVLGVNCSKCNMLFLRVNQVVSNYSINAEVIKIEDAQKMATYNFPFLPALVINGKVVSKGTIPSEREILCFINDFLPEETKIQLPVENKSSKKLLIIGTLVVLVVVLLLVLKNNQINASASKILDTTSANAKPRTYKDWVNQLYSYSQQSTSYKITFLEFGSTNCRPCKEMEKVMQQVKENYKDKVNVVFYNVREKENKKMVDFFKIEIIPAQVFLDEKGVEFFRHEGYFSKEEVISVLRKKGVE